ncbi:MAG: Hsp20/alpha crystallin family protein [Candidatus Ryanbacteria bacterium]|nr:Hsp20/alpha crystallin family protein [Candidatus Ryanbacteria bacterium]
MPKTRSFFERLTGSVSRDSYYGDEAETQEEINEPPKARLAVSQARTRPKQTPVKKEGDWLAEEAEEGQLTVDVFQSGDDIVIQSTVAGVKPDDLDVQITRDMITIRGKREQAREVAGEDYYYQELYWGSFARSIMLPNEVDVDEAEATLKNGLLTIKLPKLDKNRTERLRVKTREE